jgi:hypothetical protein
MRGEWYAIIGMVLLTFGGFPLAMYGTFRISRRYKQNGGNRIRADLLEILGLLLMAAATLPVLILTVGAGRFWVFEVPIKLAVGWIAYLDRIDRQVEPDAMHVLSAVVCLAATTIVAHLFLRWLAASAGRSWPVKRTFQALVLVALMFASGLAVTGLVQQTSWLIRTPEPLVKDARSFS